MFTSKKLHAVIPIWSLEKHINWTMVLKDKLSIYGENYKCILGYCYEWWNVQCSYPVVCLTNSCLTLVSGFWKQRRALREQSDATQDSVATFNETHTSIYYAQPGRLPESRYIKVDEGTRSNKKIGWAGEWNGCCNHELPRSRDSGPSVMRTECSTERIIIPNSYSIFDSVV